MLNHVTIKMNEDYTFKIPSEIAEKCHMQKGTELFLIEKDGVLILSSKEQINIWEELKEAISDLRKSVKAQVGK